MGIKLICDNRQSRHLYELLEFIEAGLVLKGTEVKSLRAGQAALKDSFARADHGEMFLYNVHIPPYSHGNRSNLEPTRTRKLLLNRSEINRLMGKVKQRGYTLIPTKLYFKDGRAKVEIALAKGKKAWDKRESIKKKDIEREMGRSYREKFKA